MYFKYTSVLTGILMNIRWCTEVEGCFPGKGCCFTERIVRAST